MKSLNINIPTTVRFIKTITKFWVFVFIMLITLLYIYFWLNTEEVEKNIVINVESIFTVNNSINIRIELQCNNPYVYGRKAYMVNSLEKPGKNKIFDLLSLYCSFSTADTSYFRYYSKFKEEAFHYYYENSNTIPLNDSPYEILSFRPKNKSYTLRPILMCQVYSENLKYLTLSSYDDNTFEEHEDFVYMSDSIYYIQYDRNKRSKRLELYKHQYSSTVEEPCGTIKYYGRFYNKNETKKKKEETYYDHPSSIVYPQKVLNFDIDTLNGKEKSIPEISDECISGLTEFGGNFFYTLKSRFRSNIYVNTRNFNSDESTIPNMSLEFNHSNHPLHLLSLSPEPDYKTPYFFGYETPQKIRQVCNQGITLYAEIIENKDRNEKLNFILASFIGVLFSVLAEIGVKHFNGKRKPNPPTTTSGSDPVREIPVPVSQPVSKEQKKIRQRKKRKGK